MSHVVIVYTGHCIVKIEVGLGSVGLNSTKESIQEINRIEPLICLEQNINYEKTFGKTRTMENLLSPAAAHCSLKFGDSFRKEAVFKKPKCLEVCLAFSQKNTFEQKLVFNKAYFRANVLICFASKQNLLSQKQEKAAK